MIDKAINSSNKVAVKLAPRGKQHRHIEIWIKRVYAPPKRSDGLRVLIDGLWPRGMSKDTAHVDLWLKAIAPSASLRRWFDHRPERWTGFLQRYRKELHANRRVIAELLAQASRSRLTLLYSARDTEHNNAVALVRYLAARQRRTKKGT
ncbi:MAG TPA: DUF488 family protein [Pyrinomonadaceae bacterium]|nr:DUF488 family protein [Pyrinomonadaceae bacterium]